LIFFLKLNLTSYSTILGLSARKGDWDKIDLKKYVDRWKFSVFVIISELLERAEERKGGTEKNFLRFRRDGHEKK